MNKKNQLFTFVCIIFLVCLVMPGSASQKIKKEMEIKAPQIEPIFLSFYKLEELPVKKGIEYYTLELFLNYKDGQIFERHPEKFLRNFLDSLKFKVNNVIVKGNLNAKGAQKVINIGKGIAGQLKKVAIQVHHYPDSTWEIRIIFKPKERFNTM